MFRDIRRNRHDGLEQALHAEVAHLTDDGPIPQDSTRVRKVVKSAIGDTCFVTALALKHVAHQRRVVRRGRRHIHHLDFYLRLQIIETETPSYTYFELL